MIAFFNVQAFIHGNIWVVGLSMAKITGVGKSHHLLLELGLLLFLDTFKDATHESHFSMKGEVGFHPCHFISS